MKASQILKEADESQHTKFSYKDAKGYCAIGLIGCKVGEIRSDGELNTPEERLFPRLGVKFVENIPCPAGCYDVNDDLSGMLVHLNDDHGWTFKQIGEWLEQFETEESKS